MLNTAQIVQIVSMPIGKTLEKLDACVLIEREKIRRHYLELLSRDLSHADAALRARAFWLDMFLDPGVGRKD